MVPVRGGIDMDKKKKKQKKKKTAVVMAKWGSMKWQYSSKKILPIEDDLKIDYAVNDKNKKQKQTVSFSYIPYAATGSSVKKEVAKWGSLVGQVHPLYIGKKRFGPAKLRLKSASASDIQIYAGGKALKAGIALSFEEKKGKAKKNSKKKEGTTKAAKKTTKKKAKSK